MCIPSAYYLAGSASFQISDGQQCDISDVRTANWLPAGRNVEVTGLCTGGGGGAYGHGAVEVEHLVTQIHRKHIFHHNVTSELNKTKIDSISKYQGIPKSPTPVTSSDFSNTCQ